VKVPKIIPLACGGDSGWQAFKTRARQGRGQEEEMFTRAELLTTILLKNIKAVLHMFFSCGGPRIVAWGWWAWHPRYECP
jgi:hypothetical protein